MTQGKTGSKREMQYERRNKAIAKVLEVCVLKVAVAGFTSEASEKDANEFADELRARGYEIVRISETRREQNKYPPFKKDF